LIESCCGDSFIHCNAEKVAAVPQTDPKEMQRMERSIETLDAEYR